MQFFVIQSLSTALFVLIAVGLPLAIPIVMFTLNYRKSRQLMELHHIERMAAIERGMELPPLPIELIEGKSARRHRTSLLPGLIWLFAGLAAWAALRSIAAERALLALIPAGIGLAYLVYYFFEGRTIESRQREHDLGDVQAAEARQQVR